MKSGLPWPLVFIVLAALAVAFVPLPAWVGPTPGPSAGPRGLHIIRESRKDTPAFGRLANSLRNQQAAYLKEKGHECLILDVDNDAKQVAEWKSAISGMTPPVAVCFDLKSRKLLDKQSIADNVTAADVIEWLKKNGG